MTIRLTVDRERWWNHVTDVAADVPNLVPVVKGNGYGFGRMGLSLLAVKLSPVIAVGTVFELAGLPEDAVPVVLTPTLTPPESTEPILTVGAPEHVEALRGWSGRVLIKLESSMHRYGRGTELVPLAQSAGLRTVGVSIHPPLAGDEADHLADVERWLPSIDPSLDVWVSHLSPDSYQRLPDSHRFHLRSGTYLWLGDRGAIHLGADVLDARPVSAGDRVGYRQVAAPTNGTIIMIGAGTANGVAALDAGPPDAGPPDAGPPDAGPPDAGPPDAGPPGCGLSPFHYQRRRMPLVEPPHMHTSMVLVADGDPTPEIGDWVDLQRPLTMTAIDELTWT